MFWFLHLLSLQLMEYSYLLDMADKTEDPYMRMVYACKHIPTLLVLPCSFFMVWLISFDL